LDEQPLSPEEDVFWSLYCELGFERQETQKLLGSAFQKVAQLFQKDKVQCSEPDSELFDGT